MEHYNNLKSSNLKSKYHDEDKITALRRLIV